jgi:hypothetical protein
MRKLGFKTHAAGDGLLLLAILALGQARVDGQEQKPANPESKPGQPLARKLDTLRAQADKPTLPSLEAVLTDALKSNPDIRVAEAKVREAEAELNKIRLQVLQRVVALHQAVESQKEALKNAQSQYEGYRTRFEVVQIQAPELARMRGTLSLEKGKLATQEAELNAVLGKLPQGMMTNLAKPGIDFATTNIDLDELARFVARRRDSLSALGALDLGNVGFPPGQTSKRSQSTGGPLAEKIRSALDKPITIKIQDGGLAAVIAAITRLVPDVPFHTLTQADIGLKANLHFEQVALGAILQAVEDSFPGPPGVRLVIRDYGILVTLDSIAPAGAVSVHDFWKGRTGEEKSRVGQATAKNPPAIEVEGVVKKADPQSGFIQINIGSDAGIRPGHTLEVYRLKPDAKYVGTIEIVAVKTNEAVAKPQPPSRGSIQVGDQVVGRLKTAGN